MVTISNGHSAYVEQTGHLVCGGLRGQVTFGILARIHCEMAVPRLSKHQAQSPSTTRTFIAKLQHSQNHPLHSVLFILL